MPIDTAEKYIEQNFVECSLEMFTDFVKSNNLEESRSCVVGDNHLSSETMHDSYFNNANGKTKAIIYSSSYSVTYLISIEGVRENMASNLIKGEIK